MRTTDANGGIARARPIGRRLHVLIAGGGVAALETALALRTLAAGLVEVELLAPEHHFWYRPLAVAEPFGLANARAFELSSLAAAAGAHFTPGALASVDADARVAVTADGAAIPYDVLVVASGARPEPVLSGAFTFRGPADSEGFRDLLAEIEAGKVRRLAFAVPGGVVWPLPLYELALMTAAHVRRVGAPAVALALVTHEPEPLSIFGEAGSTAVSSLLAERGIYPFCGRYSVAVRAGELAVLPTGSIPADRVVALPRLVGAELQGVPRDGDGFVPTDVHGRVVGLDSVYAAGDVTAFPVKQGGIATQQADAVAEAIAAEAGAAVEPKPFRPVLRGLLLTGGVPSYLRADLAGGQGDTSLVADEALWWPPGKIVGRHLAPFLAARNGFDAARPAAGPGVVEIDADLSELDPARAATLRPAAA